jgi:pimeloyl-ACP methyl ester carboxylesterase
MNALVNNTQSALKQPDGSSIAYIRSVGTDNYPGVIFCGGFFSDMRGTKAMWLERFCRSNGQTYLRFDYFGHGVSSGRFEEGTIGRWTEDTVAILDCATNGPQILVGSSMGGWIATLAALARPQKIVGLITIASAVDFTEDVLWAGLALEARKHLESAGLIHLPSSDGLSYPITSRLIKEGRSHLLLQRPIPLTCPVRLIHGMVDTSIPWKQSLRLAEALTSSDVRLILVKDGDHRLVRDSDLAIIGTAVSELSL